MALSGVEIFKLLPKTNCKKCGHPTCLAFAMKLAQRQASLDLCPDISEEAKKVLGEASAPPIRPTVLGAGDKAVKLGEERSVSMDLMVRAIPVNHGQHPPACPAKPPKPTLGHGSDVTGRPICPPSTLGKSVKPGASRRRSQRETALCPRKHQQKHMFLKTCLRSGPAGGRWGHFSPDE